MKAVLFLFIFYFIVARDLVCSDSQEECANKKSEKCESKMREKTKHVKDHPLTKELCCPELERRKCLRKAYHECEQHSRLPQSKYAGCETYSVKCDGCRNGISTAVLALLSLHLFYILK